MKSHCYRVLWVLVAAGAGMGCRLASEPASAPSPAATQTEPAAEVEPGGFNRLAPVNVGDYRVESLHVGDLANGHFNLYITGGEVDAVRAWVGDEQATDAYVGKANWEDDHYCAHLEMPQPVPAEARLWFEIESRDGRTLKGSTVLQAAGS